MRLSARIARLERARPRLSRLELYQALSKELDKDEPTCEATRQLDRAFLEPDVRHEDLNRVAEAVQADPELSAAMETVVGGIARARERLAARGIHVPMWTSLAEILYGP